MENITEGYIEDIKQMENLMQNEISFRSSGLDDLVDISRNNLDNYLCPLTVFAVSKLKGQASQDMTQVAAIFQYVFLAHSIHAKITDQDIDEHVRQYPVLVGDFMLGQTFMKLCQNELFPYARQFVELIKTINEGVVLRWRLRNKNISSKEYLLIFSKERAALVALAAKITADIIGLQPFHKELEEFGFNIGMAWAAWEAWEESSHGYLVQEYLAKAKDIISGLPDELYSKPLQDVYEFFKQETNSNIVLAEIQ